MCDLDTSYLDTSYFKGVQIVRKLNYTMAKLHLAELTMPGNFK